MTEDATFFAIDFLPCVLKLANDVVPNFCIVAAKTLSKFTETGAKGASIIWFDLVDVP